MDEFLKEFFAVTRTSVYCVKLEDNKPIVEKIALRGKSVVAIGQKLMASQYILLTKSGLYTFDNTRIIAHLDYCGEKGGEREINFPGWLSKTSPVKALFLNKAKAIDCLNTENEDIVQWEKETKSVLDAIGDNHPVFKCEFF